MARLLRWLISVDHSGDDLPASVFLAAIDGVSGIMNIASLLYRAEIFAASPALNAFAYAASEFLNGSLFAIDGLL
jgi:hypothetical protein